MQITLTVIEGPNRGTIFTFTEHTAFLVGRSPEAHFCFPETDRYFSRLHFMVEVNPPLCRLLDMKSHNGTQVNGQRVQSIDLKDGDQIQAGHTVLRVSLLDAEAGKPGPTLSEVPKAVVRFHAIRARASPRPLSPAHEIAESPGVASARPGLAPHPRLPGAEGAGSWRHGRRVPGPP